MPRAAAQIEDLHFSACYTGGQAIDATTREPWTTTFPNLKTIWSYGKSSPLAPTDHLRSWAVSTRGRTERLAPQQPGVAAWGRASGVTTPLPSYAELVDAKRSADAGFDRLVSGATEIHRPDQQPASDDYATYRQLSRHPQASAETRRECAERADKLLRIRYYDGGVRGNFQRAHATAIADGYRALGLRAPDFSSLSREQAVAEIARYDAVLATLTSAPAQARSLATVLAGLRDLDAKAIPETWTTH
jgi:hypothetical protein